MRCSQNNNDSEHEQGVNRHFTDLGILADRKILRHKRLAIAAVIISNSRVACNRIVNDRK